jgi:hypothetical protein
LSNQGGTPAGPFWLEYFGSLDGGLTLHHFLAQSDRIAGLDPGATITRDVTKHLASVPDGVYSVVVAVDRLHEVPEFNIANNRHTLAQPRVRVMRPPTGANLVLENFSFTPGATWPAVNLGGIVRNAGTVDSGSFWIEFWVAPGDPDYPWPTRFACESIHVDNLAAGATIDLAGHRRDVYTLLNPGQYVVIGFVDRPDHVAESDETDNYRIVRGFVVPAH